MSRKYQFCVLKSSVLENPAFLFTNICPYVLHVGTSMRCFPVLQQDQHYTSSNQCKPAWNSCCGLCWIFQQGYSILTTLFIELLYKSDVTFLILVWISWLTLSIFCLTNEIMVNKTTAESTGCFWIWLHIRGVTK